MRHNHQTILGCGMMQAYLYFGRLYGLGCAQIWKSWCDDLVLNATYWGHAPENSPNYEPRTFLEVADMLHYQGLSTKDQEGTRNWPLSSMRFLSLRDSFGLPSCYGDCWDWSEFDSLAGWVAGEANHSRGARRIALLESIFEQLDFVTSCRQR